MICPLITPQRCVLLTIENNNDRVLDRTWSGDTECLVIKDKAQENKKGSKQ